VENNYANFKALFDIWRQKNYAPYFYFTEIFGKSLSAIVARAREERIELGEAGSPKYPALFVPVGLSIENVVIIASLFKPTYLTLGFSEMSRHFHSRHMKLIYENIKKLNPTVNIRESTVLSDDQRLMEQKIVEWVEEMKVRNGLSYEQMAIDLTGGTKPMSIGAHNAALSYQDIDAFYIRADYDEDTQWPVPGTETLIRLKKNNVQVEKNLVFAVMPFKDEFGNIYEQGIKVAAERLGKKCVRVDGEIFTGVIMDRIRDNLLKANVIVAELTEQNPNVYYELGLAHAYGKKVIMMTQNISQVPFDLRHLKMVVYNKDDLNQLADTLAKEIKHLMEDG
jgi:hypothetical protein